LLVVRQQDTLASEEIAELAARERPRRRQNPNFVVNDPVTAGRFGGRIERLLASCNHRDSVCCLRPVSIANCRALIASLPLIRASIFCL
jgi:hypothetical protein